MHPTVSKDSVSPPAKYLGAREPVRVFVDPTQGSYADRAHRLRVALGAGQVDLDSMNRDGFTLLPYPCFCFLRS